MPLGAVASCFLRSWRSLSEPDAGTIAGAESKLASPQLPPGMCFVGDFGQDPGLLAPQLRGLRLPAGQGLSRSQTQA